MGLLRKGISEEKFNEVFPQFDRVSTIEIEEMKKGDFLKFFAIFYGAISLLCISR